MFNEKKVDSVKTPFDSSSTTAFSAVDKDGQGFISRSEFSFHQTVISNHLNVELLEERFPNAQNFVDFLRISTRDQINLSHRVLECIGRLLSADKDRKTIFLFQGGPHSGKDILLKLLPILLDENYIKIMDAISLKCGFEAFEWSGKQVCIWPEIGPMPIRTAAVAKLDEVLHMSAESNSCSNYILATSYPFLTNKEAEGLLDNLVAIPLPGEIPEEMRTSAFFETIKEERDAIATIAVNHYATVYERNGRYSGHYPVNSITLLPPCEGVCTNKEESVRQFAQTRCEQNKEMGTDAEVLYDRFIREYGYITFTEFANLFEHCAKELYGAERVWGSNFFNSNYHCCFAFVHLKECE